MTRFGYFWKGLVDKLPYEISPHIWHLRLFWSCHNSGYFLATFGKIRLLFIPRSGHTDHSRLIASCFVKVKKNSWPRGCLVRVPALYASLKKLLLFGNVYKSLGNFVHNIEFKKQHNFCWDLCCHKYLDTIRPAQKCYF